MFSMFLESSADVTGNSFGDGNMDVLSSEAAAALVDLHELRI